jgi:hypothetical protein
MSDTKKSFFPMPFTREKVFILLSLLFGGVGCCGVAVSIWLLSQLWSFTNHSPVLPQEEEVNSEQISLMWKTFYNYENI